MIRCFTVDGPWFIGKKASAGLDWWLLPYACLISAHGRQHTLIHVPVHLCTCLSVFSFSPCLLLSLSLNPLLPQSICCQKQPEYLSASLFAFLSSCSSKREGAGQLTFPAPQCTQAHIQKGIWYLSPAFLQLMKDVKKIRGERNILSGTSEWPQGISALRGTD